MTDLLAEKRKKLESAVRREGRVAVACSGGVDSTLLLKFAYDILGHNNTIAVFADTELLPPGESEAVADVVGHIGSRQLTVSLDPLSWPEFTSNPRDRCYLCKKKIYQTFQEKLSEMDFDVLMDGTNLDDLSDFRPGLKALAELQIRKPLADAGLTKSDIRKLSRELELPNWNKHSSSCLATRIATGQDINREKLELIRRCEGFLHELGFMGCRVRISDDSAVIELLESDLERFVQPHTRHLVARKLNDFRIDKVTLNMSGRTGNLS